MFIHLSQIFSMLKTRFCAVMLLLTILSPNLHAHPTELGTKSQSGHDFAVDISNEGNQVQSDVREIKPLKLPTPMVQSVYWEKKEEIPKNLVSIEEDSVRDAKSETNRVERQQLLTTNLEIISEIRDERRFPRSSRWPRRLRISRSSKSLDRLKRQRNENRRHVRDAKKTSSRKHPAKKFLHSNMKMTTRRKFQNFKIAGMVPVVQPERSKANVHKKRMSTYDPFEGSSEQCLANRLRHRSQKWICGHYSGGEMGAILFSELCDFDQDLLRTTPMEIFDNALEMCCASSSYKTCPSDTPERHFLVLAMYLLTL